MDLQTMFRQECVSINTEVSDKEVALREIVKSALKSPILESYSEEIIFNALLERENLCSTGFEGGVAIPHCRLKGLNEFVIGLLLFPNGVEFKASDGNPTNFCFFIIGPEAHRNEHIRILSTICKQFSNEGLKKKILSLADEKELYRELSGYFPGASPEQDEKSLLTFYVQNEQLFNEILKVLPGTAAAVVITEGEDVSSHFYKLPLFSTFWNSEESETIRIVRAIVSQKMVNEIVRETNILKDRLGVDKGCVTTVENLVYTAGSLLV